MLLINKILYQKLFDHKKYKEELNKIEKIYFSSCCILFELQYKKV